MYREKAEHSDIDGEKVDTMKGIKRERDDRPSDNGFLKSDPSDNRDCKHGEWL